VCEQWHLPASEEDFAEVGVACKLKSVFFFSGCQWLACNHSYLGGWDQEDSSLRPACANSSRKPIHKITRAKMDRRCGSSSRVPYLQVWSPYFEPQSHQKERKKKVLFSEEGIFRRKIFLFSRIWRIFKQKKLQTSSALWVVSEAQMDACSL
jgi:hypothetical protein